MQTRPSFFHTRVHTMTLLPASSRLTRALASLLAGAVLPLLPQMGMAQTAAAPAAAAAAATVTPGIAGVVAAGTSIEFIKDGFNGTEGPVSLPDGSLLFTETQAERITRIAEDGSISTFLEESNGANGLGIAPNGDVYAVQVKTGKTRVGIVFPPGRRQVLVDKFEGLPFGRPNDLVLDTQRNVYFTDSGANVRPGDPPPPPSAPPAVYRITAKGQLERIAADIERPNGIQLSPDEKVLYVANTNGEYVLAYDIGADGRIGPRRNFAKLAGYKPNPNGAGGSSGADGLAVDAQGRLYVASNSGIEIFDAKGQALGVIALPRQPQNLAFAGVDKQTLYVVGRGAAYRIHTLTPGFAGRAK
jgi:gluconolactonase